MTLTATPDPGSVFLGWIGDADCSDGMVTMQADKTCVALFQLLSSDWGISPIDKVKGSYTSIAVDFYDQVHISYEARHPDGFGGDLKYATNATGQWVTTTVDSTGGVGISCSIAVDWFGSIHISYYDWLNLDLKYATNATGQWVTTTVDSLGNVGATTSIAVDKGRKAHIIYHDSTSGVSLKYATNATGQWVTTTIDNSGGLCAGGLTIGIAADQDNQLHITYCDANSGTLKYANNLTGSWVATTVDSLGGWGSDVSIAVDPEGYVHISYSQINNIPETGFGDLKYATNATGQWVTTTVDSTGDTGGRTSIGLAPDGNVHISYYDFTNWNLKHAIKAGDNWTMETIDSGYVGEFTATSLALDSNAKVHISYYTGADVAQMVGYGPLYTTNQPQDLSVLSVTPVDGFSSSGSAGGPFTPSSKAYTLENTGGSPINWTASTGQTWVTLSSSSGTLAAGDSTTVTVSINSGANLLSSGSYTDLVTFTNTTNDRGNTTRPVDLTVNPPSITVSVPNGGETWVAGATQTISWTYAGSPGSYVKIELFKGGVLNRTISSSRSIGSGGNGSYSWPISSTQTGGSDYQIKVTSTTNSAYTDTSDGYFTIPGPTITVSVPNGGETWAAGTTQTINWTYTGSPGNYVKIELFKGGVLNRTITSSRPIGSGGSGSYPWAIPSTQAGGSDYQIKVTSTTNSTYTDTSDANFTITGPPPPSITVISPNGGENLAAGTTQTISWTYTGSPGSYAKIELFKGGVLNRTISSLRSIGSGGNGSYSWTIPSTQTGGSDYQIKVTSTTNSAYTDTSDANFTITGPPPPSITVTSPNGGESLAAGTTQTISWTYAGSPGSYVKIQLFKGGVLNRTITSNRSIGSGGNGSYSWAIPSTQAGGSDYQIKVTSTTNSACTHTSDANFTITGPPPPSITVVTPNGGENWAAGTTQTISWTYAGSPGSYVKIELFKGGVLNLTISSSSSIGTAGSGSYSWLILSTQAGGSDYQIRVTSTTNSAYTDTSNANFTITGPTPPSITVTSPDGGENWVAGSTQTIQWTYTGNPGSSVRIDLLKGGKLYRTISSSTSIGTAGSGSRSWAVTSTLAGGSDYQIRVTSTTDSAYTDTSNGNFTITGP